jgi:hypothetical protein
MMNESHTLASLASRVERGDREAAFELRRFLDGGLGPVIRRALRPGTPTSALEKQIQVLAQRACPKGCPPGDRVDPGLVSQIGHMLSQRLVARLQAQADSFQPCAHTVAV